MNQWLDSYQIFVDIYFGHNKEVIKFYGSWHNFQGHNSRTVERLKIHDFTLKILLLIYDLMFHLKLFIFIILIKELDPYYAVNYTVTLFRNKFSKSDFTITVYA